MKILLKLAQWYSWSQTYDILSFSLAVLKSNLKEPNLTKGTSDIMSLISRSSPASIPSLPEEVRVMILSPSVSADKRIIFISLPYKKKNFINHIYFKMPRAWSLLMLFLIHLKSSIIFFFPVFDLIWQIWNLQRRSLWLKEKKKRNIQLWRSQYE